MLSIRLIFLLFTFFCTGSSLNYCTDRNHPTICANNDTYCGNWDVERRAWTPLDCVYRDVSAEQANKCLTNRTIQFFGDSQIRDLSLGVMKLLFGVEVMEAEDVKFDHSDYHLNEFADYPLDFERWSSRRQKQDWLRLTHGIFPKEELRQPGMTWQLQMWQMTSKIIYSVYGRDVLENRMVNETAVRDSSSAPAVNTLRPADISFYNNGLHDLGLWSSDPIGKSSWDFNVVPWLEMTKSSKAAPSVWVSHNSECTDILKEVYHNQASTIEEANYYIHRRMLHEQLPYFDAASVLRSPQRCQVSGDGLHVKQWVDVARAKILFNYLCDEDWNWKGGIDAFVNT